MRTILIGFMSCTLPYRFFKPKGFTSKYDGQYTGLDTLIDIEGYYIPNKECENPEAPDKEYITSVMFYKDGLVCMTIDNPVEVFQEGKYSVGSWGRYIVKGDTIKVQSILDLGLMDDIRVPKVNYLIVSKNKLKSVEDVPQNKYCGSAIYNFHALENHIDSSSCNLLKKKWFWTKEAWKKRKNK